MAFKKYYFNIVITYFDFGIYSHFCDLVLFKTKGQDLNMVGIELNIIEYIIWLKVLKMYFNSLLKNCQYEHLN